MARSADRRAAPRRRRRGGWTALLLALMLAGTALYALGWVDHWSGHDRVAPTPAPRPLALSLPSSAAAAGPVASAAPVAEPAVGGALKRGRLQRLLDHGLTSALGRHVLAAVAGASGAPVASSGSGVAVPASTNKLLTAAAVLALDGPERRFTTRVVSADARHVVLVGGGDPLLTARPAHGYPRRADLTTLAQETAAALRQQGRTTVRLQYDAGLFTGPAVNPTWPGSYLSEGVVSPITALWVDEGRIHSGTGRSSDPTGDAVAVFARALGTAGIRVKGTPVAAAAPTGAATLAQVQSAPLREIVDHVLETSDNEGAEVLAHQAGVAAGTGGSFDGGVAAVGDTLARLGVDTGGLQLHDGSGLSREDRIAPVTLLQVLQRATSDDRLAPIVSALPVAGFSGSLLGRYDQHGDAGRGVVRAKTGTLTGVDALAGYTQDAQGTPLVFVLMADRVAVPDTLAARDALDHLASTLTTCRCG